MLNLPGLLGGLMLPSWKGGVGGGSWGNTCQAQISITALPKTVAGGYNISCNGGTDGQINTVVTGNAGPYTFAWGTSTTLSVTGYTDKLVNGIAGTYWVTVTDSLNNTASDTVTLIQPSVLTAGIDAHTFGGGTHISEFGASDGLMESVVNGGIPPYTYLWVPSPSSGSGQGHPDWDYKEQPAGEYNLTVTDAAGCTANADITLTEPPEFTVDVELIEREGNVHISCNGSKDGQAVAIPTGGVPPYTFAWFSGETDSIAHQLSGGSNKVSVTDANGVERSVNFEVLQPDTFNVEVTANDLYPNGYHVSCWNCSNATLTATPNGGVVPYTYQWYKNQTNGEAILTNAGQRSYELIVTDANGCKARMARTSTVLLIPDRDDWTINGNSGLNADSTAKWLGTSDSTDLMMKANNQPMLRLGADGVVEINGIVKLPELLSNQNDLGGPIGVDGNGNIVRIGGSGQSIDPCIEFGYDIIPSWQSEPNEIFVACEAARVGIGTTDPLEDLDIRGDLAMLGNFGVGLTISPCTLPECATAFKYDFLPYSVADIRGNTIIGYQTGVGPANANAALDVRADGDAARFTFETRDNAGRSSLRVRNNGKVVVGNGAFNDSNDGMAVLFFGNEEYNISSTNGVGLRIGASSNSYGIVIPENTNDVLIPNRMRIGVEKVIAGPHTNYKLCVDGKIVAKEIFVSTDENYWADFVFEKGYPLWSLEKVEHFIDSVGHLPDVPSAADIAKNGQDLGRMDAILLRKIEELTLYIIELNKEKAESEERNVYLFQKLKELTQRITQLEGRPTSNNEK